jgi:hypothetical protein
MSARPLSSAAALLAALALILISSMPAGAAVRNHRDHASKMARWNAGPTANHKRSVKRPRPLASIGIKRRPRARAASEDPQFGVFTNGSPYSGNVESIEKLQAALGRRIDIVNWYQNWEPGSWAEQFHPGVVDAVVRSGRTPLLTWEPWDPAAGPDQPQFRLRRIANGDFDGYIASWADQLKKVDTKVYLRPMHEMNGNWYPWGATIGDNTARLYIEAWRRMVSIFRRHGARNVKFVWCPVPFSVPDTRNNQLEDYYPGTRYVDVLSLDGYNWGSKHPDYGGWQSFESIFGDAYKRLTKLGPQPIWIAEVGSAPEGGNKAAWVRDMWATAREMPRLKALVWFDQDKEEDWRALPVASAFAD